MVAPKLTDYEKRIQELQEYIKEPLLLIKDITELADITATDVHKCVDISNDNLGDQSWQRLVIRATFSAIDSGCYKIKELVYCAANICHIKLSEHDKELLLEFKKDKHGSFRRCYPSLGENVKFTLNIAAKLFKSNPIVLDNNDWMNFREAIGIRDRITHPKHARDLFISPDEYDKVANALCWFVERLFEIKVAFSGVAKVR